MDVRAHDGLVTIEEAAQAVGCSMATIRNATQRGALPSHLGPRPRGHPGLPYWRYVFVDDLWDWWRRHISQTRAARGSSPAQIWARPPLKEAAPR